MPTADDRRARLCVLAGQRAHGRRPAGQSRIRSPSRSTATAILVDVVVRDGKGRPLTDLSRQPISRSTEDGVPQKSTASPRVARQRHRGGRRLESADRRSTSRPTGGGGCSRSCRHSRRCDHDALVFDHLSPETLRLAQKATLDYVPVDRRVGRRGSACSRPTPACAPCSEYTTDRALVRQAVARVAALRRPRRSRRPTGPTS